MKDERDIPKADAENVQEFISPFIDRSVEMMSRA